MAIYLEEHRDNVLASIELLALESGESWETVAWVRTAEDAQSLVQLLEAAVRERTGSAYTIGVEVIDDPDERPGVSVTVRA
ncbi:MAG: hypothetical protein ACYTGN_18635 [Planctomycetota bacterium]|jgi:hypothetical protein